MEAPFRFLETDRVAPDTYVVRQLIGEGTAPVAVPMNSMVITGQEPVIVDCGPAIVRDAWLEHTFELVEPDDVRWIFLSHDDTDHTGNLLPVLEMCPNATLVTNWFSVERMAADHLLPLDRMRWVEDGEWFVAGDRRLVAVMPPVFDSPTTRGLYDVTTGVYWGADSFALAVPHEVADIDELDPEFVRRSFSQVQRTLSPWHRWLDPVKYGAHLDRVAALGAQVVAAGHAVTLRGRQVDLGFELLRDLPNQPPVDLPGQAELELILATIGAPAPAIA